MDILFILLLILISVGLTALITIVTYFILKSPFKFPYHIIKFDVSGKRSPNINDLIDNYININGFKEFTQAHKTLQKWKTDCQNRIQKSKLKKLRTKQFENIIDDEHLFHFKLIRKQTRYKQVNYVKTAYSVYITVDEYTDNFKSIQRRFNELLSINFECTLSEYNSKEQRKLMTTVLREEVAKRDNYTCQICGKYMPDGVGLHIDHIVPIKKGGKSIRSNLQVLCSKCNGKKSSN